MENIYHITFCRWVLNYLDLEKYTVFNSDQTDELTANLSKVKAKVYISILKFQSQNF